MPTSDSTPSTVPALDKRDWIAGLEKGLAVIECFDDANPRLTASQAGARCGMTRKAVALAADVWSAIADHRGGIVFLGDLGPHGYHR